MVNHADFYNLDKPLVVGEFSASCSSSNNGKTQRIKNMT